jgi:hypothetical protein
MLANRDVLLRQARIEYSDGASDVGKIQNRLHGDLGYLSGESRERGPGDQSTHASL